MIAKPDHCVLCKELTFGVLQTTRRHIMYGIGHDTGIVCVCVCVRKGPPRRRSESEHLAPADHDTSWRDVANGSRGDRSGICVDRRLVNMLRVVVYKNKQHSSTAEGPYMCVCVCMWCC